MKFNFSLTEGLKLLINGYLEVTEHSMAFEVMEKYILIL